MKRLFCLTLAFAILISVVPLFASATENEILYFEDGSYIIIETVCNSTRASGAVSGGKQYTYYDSDGVSKWKAVLNGSFTYTGSSATCTSSSVDVTVYDVSWYVSYKYAGKSGNSATASVTMARTVDGTTLTKVPVTLILTCDANGNLS